MKIVKEISLKEFPFWGGAKDYAALLTDEEFDLIEENLKEICPNGMGETETNDFFWFDTDTYAEWLGIRIETLYEERYKG